MINARGKTRLMQLVIMVNSDNDSIIARNPIGGIAAGNMELAGEIISNRRKRNRR